MDARLLYPNKYISAADLQGRDVHLTIVNVRSEEVRNSYGVEKKAIVRFKEFADREGQEKPHLWIMPKTMMKLVAKMLDTYETDAWVGKRITLYPTTTDLKGEIVDCIRVRPKLPPQQRSRKRQPEPEPLEAEHDSLPEDDLEPELPTGEDSLAEYGESGAF